MSDHDPRKYSSFALYPAFIIGVEDGINPCGFAAALILMLYLSFIGYTRRHIILYGGLLIFSAWLTQFTIAFGFWDYFLTLNGVLFVVQGLYWLLAGIFLVLGILNILDWWRYKKYLDMDCFRVKLPAFFRIRRASRVISQRRKIVLVMGIAILTFLVGEIVALMGSIYPQDEYIFIVHSFFMSGGDRVFVYWSMILYSFAMVLPMIVAWLMILVLVSLKKRNSKVILYYKGVTAALFLSTGTGLGCFLLKSLF